MPHPILYEATMAYIAIAVTVIGAATTYVGQQKAADAAEEAGKMQKKAADQNARNTELQTAENIRRERMNNRRRLARMRSDMAGTSGLVFDGTMEDAFLETAGQMELQIQDTARAGAMEAANSRSAGAMAQWEARAQATATRTQATGTLISSVAGAGNSYARIAPTGQSKPPANASKK